MSITEWYAVVYKVVSSVSSVGKSVLGAGGHIIFVKFHCIDHAGEKSQTAFYGVDSIKGKFLIFLHIFIVGKRNALHSCEHGN